ncbi:2,4-dihydroxyhept-2-ene-1,7-dioic acid aldolase [Hydrogenibacillus schlegelii]|uniref:4-hydroxy-tetrahydrodipicolinate synthase n=1 Tax=Hydrogenibacillus schlegelii TaxID=1484 RepID=A0A132N4U5_HYDSH|nr:2,4-dihydroxyhept-2-ene-1,7-dioic acid aldolase [Hydrogenibacillus schlegelii]KWX05179.1 dihydrodipicolinate synthase [Hydrogenibacillus schlegelii]MBT9283340.1 2,4-dihydroxyhept-2-ene-1,7-dioic acid aldolase [Hydrogenibacillus schlegelii]OAR03195.1 4-hydroxy-tetrahydrodipicolinate synthase [Hydrogenibacillus schlegelii]PTQ51837.1 MAG: 4-hydroxy-tetrahydrodipicolinate synthase [Hydrogenibacillus schlegelii]
MTYDAVKKRLRGSIAPVVTPFTADGAVDYATLEALIDWQIRSGSHGISVTGTSGEPSSLTLEERKEVIRVAKSAVGGRVPFVPATGSVNHAETLELTKFAETIGADAAMVIVPYYVRPTQEGLYRHFLAVARSVDLPILIYNIPGRTAVNLEVSTLARLVEAAPNIVGIKESNKDFEHVNRVLGTVGRDFLLFSGIELLCYPMLAIGGAGSISATANVFPSKVAEMHDAWFAGDVKKAQDLHYELMELNDLLFVETNPGPVKAALGLMGKITPYVRPPLALPGPELTERIRTTLLRYGLLEEATQIS